MTDDHPATGPTVATRRRGLDRKRRLTLMSVDLVGSTPLAARLDPERLRDVILTYHDICDQAIARYDGRVGARAGDGLMVHFGVSNPHEDDARRATLAALAIIDAMTPLANEVAARDGATLQVRVGVHTGPVVITEIGGRTDIVGTTPNETARIESSARPGTVSVSEATHELIAKDFEFELPLQVALRGVEAPMTTYTVTGVSAHTTRPRAVIPFVGRVAERDCLEALWQRTVRPDANAGPASALVVGAAGLGKSRLADQLANLAAREGGSRIALEARAYDSSVPFHPFVTALVESFGLDRFDGPDDIYAALEQGLDDVGAAASAPFLAQLLGLGRERLGEAAGYEPGALHAAIVESLLAWLRASSAQRLLVVVAEDLHWADPSTIAVLTRLVSVPSAGLALVATSRPEFANPWSAGQVEVLHLRPLGFDDVAHLARLLNDVTLTDEQVERLSDHSDGVPLYIDRFVDLARRDPAFWTVETPNGLDQLVSTMIEAPGVDHGFVGLVATLGRDVEVGLVAEAVGADEATTERRLEQLCGQGILERQHVGSEASYAFHHVLLQTVAYEHLMTSDRRAAHASAAAAMERRARTNHVEPALIARHYDGAGRPADAIPRYLDASVSAQRTGALAEARRLVERALSLVTTLPADRARDEVELQLQLHLALCLESAEGYNSPGAAAASSRAFALSAALPAGRVLLRVTSDLVSFHTIRGQRAEAGAIIERARRTLADFPPAAVVLDQLEALHLYELGRLRESHERFLSVIERCERGERGEPEDLLDLPADSLAAAYSQAGVLSWHLGDADAAHDWMARAVKRARSFDGAKGAFSEAYTRSWRWMVEMKARAVSDALHTATETAELCARKGFVLWGGLAAVHIAISAAQLQPDPTTDATVGVMIDMLTGMGVASLTPYFMVEHGRVKLLMGRHAEAIDVFTRALARADEVQELHEVSEAYRLRARARLDAGGDATEIASDLRSAVAIAIGQRATVHAVRALVDLVELTDRSHWPPSALSDLDGFVASVATPDQYPEVVRAGQLLQSSGLQTS